jgi:hypothetical protein
MCSSQCGVGAISVEDEVIGTVLVSKENDTISTKTSHTGRALSETHISFGGMETSVTSERLHKLKSCIVTGIVAPVARTPQRMRIRLVSA